MFNAIKSFKSAPGCCGQKAGQPDMSKGNIDSLTRPCYSQSLKHGHWQIPLRVLQAAGGRAKLYMVLDIMERAEHLRRSKVLQRIIRAYKSKIRRQLAAGSAFSFWRVIGNIDRERLVKHIERYFEDGMTWDNYGEWHLVNTKPFSQPQTSEEFYKYVYYKNFRPEWKVSRELPVLRNGHVVKI